MISESWDDVKKTLRLVFKLPEPRIVWLGEIRERLGNLASGGISTAPDFTLHNQNHSDNVVQLLGKLTKLLKTELSEYEIYLLLASAYLHDIGMFIGAGRFNAEIMPDIARSLHVCEKDLCDSGTRYEIGLKSKPVDYQIRGLHHLLSSYLLIKDGESMFRLRGDDQRHVIIIARGHRKANLKEQGCPCFKTVYSQYNEVRRDLLASLLRLADALDYYPNRAPEEIFDTRAWDFLKNPISLKHWLDHYFATSIYPSIIDQTGNCYLNCQLTYNVPLQLTLNGRSYKEFFNPLFETFWMDAKKADFDVQNYPAVFLEIMGIKNINFTYEVIPELVDRKLPQTIINSIEQSGCKDALEFIDYLESNGRPQEKSAIPVMDRHPEIDNFKRMLDGDDPEHPLLLMAGQSGQGKTILMDTFQQMSNECQISCFRVDLSTKVSFNNILDGILQKLGSHNFPLYSVRSQKIDELDYSALKEQKRELTLCFFKEWQVISDRNRFVLLFDSFEASRGLQNWIETVFLEQLQNVKNVLVVIGGQKWPKTSDYWLIHGYRFPLNGVQLHDYRDYSVKLGLSIPESELIVLHETMKGLPESFARYVENKLFEMRAQNA